MSTTDRNPTHGESGLTGLEGEKRTLGCCQRMAHKGVRGHQSERSGFGLVVVVVVAELLVDAGGA